MKREVCPNCGGVLVAESLGWRCKSCRGFISLQDGKFYEYVEKPFMPPMTKADRIRAMSDEELAEWMSGGALKSDSACSYCKRNTLEFCNGEECTSKTDAEIILDWLRQPVKDGDNE